MAYEMKIGDEKNIFENIEELSEYVSDILNCVGYSNNIINLRREFWREMDNKRRKESERDNRITTGSKGEGLSAPYESDTDRLYIYNYAICRLAEDIENNTKHLAEIVMEQGICHAGYFKLKLKTVLIDERPRHRFRKSIVDINGVSYISSNHYTRELISDAKSILSGPAATEGDEYLSWDYVNALRCTSQQSILLEWTSRDRPHGWPSQSVIQMIIDQEAQMVPVGFIGSGERDMEWRVSFVQGEQTLTDSLNEFQYQVYILLKHIKTVMLAPICDEMSSFVMKNVTFWYIENNSTDTFSKQNLLTNVCACLTLLKEAILQKRLPYYFIKERNLLQQRIKDPEKQQSLIRKLDELKKHPMQIFDCPKLQSALRFTRRKLAEKGRWRDDLEEMFLKSDNIWRKDIPYRKEKEATRELMKDASLHSVNDEIRDMVWPNWREYEGKDIYEQLARRVKTELS
ncbi:uncharacterized protein LOC128221974 [Mya arenaria]|uniref:uncharacterized protein LOC128221974 n=1 Tax=Mya arenaria TaxID=6604 RepID=UPI0022DF8E68|nr:uncharacterized protein LOC128221974 [Mya arenaria]